MADENNAFDYIVVGGGTAGVVIASRLSQYLPDARIVVLEAGPNAIDNPHVNEFSGFPLLPHDGLLVDYSTAPQKHCDNRPIHSLAGRMLSGSSATNMGVWTRGSRTDYDAIAQKAGHERFTYGGLLPYFKRTETFWDKDADPEYHGFEGPVHTCGGREYPMRKTFQTAFEHHGFEYNADVATGDNTGFSGLTQSFRATSASTSMRQYSGKVYDLSKVQVFCSTIVRRILVDSSKTTKGVQLHDGRTLTARREVIVSCGAWKTPQVLLLSGIGPAGELSKHGISQVVDSPQVGQNLFDHLNLYQYYKLRHPEKGLALPFHGTMKPEYGQGACFDWLNFQNIPPSELKPILAIDQPNVQDTHPHLQPKRCHVMQLPFYMPVNYNPIHYPNIDMMGGNHILMVSLNMLPISRGSVTLASTDPSADPIIDPKYLSTETDRYLMRRAVRQNLVFIETEPVASEIVGETAPTGYEPLTLKSSDEEIDARVRAFVTTILHPQGTAALGTVLDSEFKLKGAKGLRVCDASVFPEPVGTMPQATVYAFAELCAELIAEDTKV